MNKHKSRIFAKTQHCWQHYYTAWTVWFS